jgi:hypothetical protein
MTSGGGGAAGGPSFEHAEAVTSTTPHRKRLELRIISGTSLSEERRPQTLGNRAAKRYSTSISRD